MGLSRQEYMTGLPFPSPEDLLHPGPGSHKFVSFTDLPILYIHIVESHNMWSFCDWLLLLSRMFSRFTDLYLCFIPFYGQMMEHIGIEFENKAWTVSDLFFLCLVRFFLRNQSLMRDLLSLPRSKQLLLILFLNILTPGRKVGLWKKVYSFLYCQEN